MRRKTLLSLLLVVLVVSIMETEPILREQSVTPTGQVLTSYKAPGDLNTLFEIFSRPPRPAVESVCTTCPVIPGSLHVHVRTPSATLCDNQYFQLAAPFDIQSFGKDDVLQLHGTGGAIILGNISYLCISHSLAMVSATVTRPVVVTSEHVVAIEDCDPLLYLDKLSRRRNLPMRRVQIAMPLQFIQLAHEYRMSLLSRNSLLFSGLYDDVMETHFSPSRTRKRRERQQRKHTIRAPVPKVSWEPSSLTSALGHGGHVHGGNDTSPSSSTFSCGALAENAAAVHQEVVHHANYATVGLGMVVNEF